MTERLNVDRLRRALQDKGWQQKELAASLQVTDAAVSQWLSGTTAPKPATLLRLARLMQLGVRELLMQSEEAPLVAYRRKGQQTTSAFNEDEALDQAYALDALADRLPARVFCPPTLARAEPTYKSAEASAVEQRGRLGIGLDRSVEWRAMLGWFTQWQSIVVPVFWGERENHGNALHIHLPRTNHTFVFINLDSERLDFKFWLAHELAHVLTPSLVGTDEGEDFADLFAGSLLFPHEASAEAYRAAVGSPSPTKALEVLAEFSRTWEVSLFTVYSQCNRLAETKGVPLLKIDPKTVHSARRRLDKSLPKVRADLFGSELPSAGKFVDVSRKQFGGEFFDALAKYLIETEAGPGFVRRSMHTSMRESVALHEELTKGATH